MGTHPIFESDFDCLTGQTRFALNAVAMMPQTPPPSRPSFPPSVLMLMKRNWARSSPSSPAKTSTRSSPKVKKNLPPSHLVEPPQLLVPPPVVLLRKHQRKRKRRRNPSLKMTTWVSIFSVKTSSTHTVVTVHDLNIILRSSRIGHKKKKKKKKKKKSPGLNHC